MTRKAIKLKKVLLHKRRTSQQLLAAKAEQYLALSLADKKRFQLAAIDDVLFWTRLTWVQFGYVYVNNAKNRKLGRVGQFTGTRFGTRNLDLIPTSKQPKSRNPSIKTIRYFDTGKFGANIRGANGKYKKADGAAVNGMWRSFGYNKVVVITKVWSFVLNKFVTDFTDFFDKNQNSG